MPCGTSPLPEAVGFRDARSGGARSARFVRPRRDLGIGLAEEGERYVGVFQFTTEAIMPAQKTSDEQGSFDDAMCRKIREALAAALARILMDEGTLLHFVNRVVPGMRLNNGRSHVPWPRDIPLWSERGPRLALGDRLAYRTLPAGRER